MLGADRFAPGAAAAHDPRVLAAIAAACDAAREAGRVRRGVRRGGRRDPVLLPLLVGLGVGELSVGAARVGATRARRRGRSTPPPRGARAAARCARPGPPRWPR